MLTRTQHHVTRGEHISASAEVIQSPQLRLGHGAGLVVPQREPVGIREDRKVAKVHAAKSAATNNGAARAARHSAAPSARSVTVHGSRLAVVKIVVMISVRLAGFRHPEVRRGALREEELRIYHFLYVEGATRRDRR